MKLAAIAGATAIVWATALLVGGLAFDLPGSSGNNSAGEVTSTQTAQQSVRLPATESGAAFGASLRLRVRGEHLGKRVRIRVRGIDSANAVVQHNVFVRRGKTLTGLTPGRYRVSARPIKSPKGIAKPTVPIRKFLVAQGDAARVQFRYVKVRIVRAISRAAWGARSPKAGMERHRPVRLTLHHSGLESGRYDGPAKIRGHQNWHMDPIRQDNQDIHYHFVVDRQGNVYEARNPKYRGGTQTTYNPKGHFLVNIEGDFQGRQKPTKVQLRSAAGVFAYAAKKWGIKPSTLAGHRHYANTTCPGDNLHQYIDNGWLQRAIRRNLAVGSTALKIREYKRGSAIVKRIEAARARS